MGFDVVFFPFYSSGILRVGDNDWLYVFSWDLLIASLPYLLLFLLEASYLGLICGYLELPQVSELRQMQGPC